MPNHRKHKPQPGKQVSKRIASDDEIRSTSDESVRSADSSSLEDEKLASSSVPGHASRLSSSSVEDFPSTRSRDGSQLTPRAMCKPGLTERQQLNLLLKSTAEGQQQRSPNPLTLPSHKKQIPRVQRRNAQGETHLHLASIRGELSTAIDLVAQGAQVNAPDNAGWTPLHEAANYGHASLVELLLRCGADANAKSIDRETPLHDAALSGREEICKMLLNYGADPLNINKDGKTAIDLTESSSIRALLSNPRPIRKIGRKSKKSKLTLLESVTDNEVSSSVFTFPGTNSPPDISSPSLLPPNPPAPAISEALEQYTSKWASGESSADETRELSPSIISKCTKITSEHPKMIHNRNSNNSEKKKKKRTKEFHHHKTSKSTSRKLFSQQEDTSNGFHESEKSRGMEECVPSQEPANLHSLKSNSDGTRKRKVHSSRTSTIKDTPHSSLPENNTPSSTLQSFKPSSKPQNKLPVKTRRVNKRTAEFLSDTTSEEDHNTSTMQTLSITLSSVTPEQQHMEEGKQKTPISDDLSSVKLLPPCKRKRPVNFSNIVQRRCEKPNPTILPTNFDKFLSYCQDYASDRIDPSAPLSHSYNFPPGLLSLYEEQERSRLLIIKRHAQEREQLQLTFEQELLRVYQRSARATPPPSACTVLSSVGRQHQPAQAPSTPLEPPAQPYDSKLLKGLVQDIYDKFDKLIQNLTARQKMDCDALYLTQVDSWDSQVRSIATKSESESSIPDS